MDSRRGGRGREMKASSPMLSNSALVCDAYVTALRAFYSAPQRERWASRQGNVRQTVPIIGGEM